MPERVETPDPNRCRHWIDIPLRYADMDANQHINNVAVGVFFETARAEYFRHLAGEAGISAPFLSIPHMSFEFRREMTFPGIVKVGTRPIALGRTSARLSQVAVWRDDITAFAEVVVVGIDMISRRPIPWAGEMKKLLVREQEA